MILQDCTSLLLLRSSCRYHRSHTTLQMGRASVVRAQTKARTDSMKNKLYCRYGKKLVMAVKAGGNDPSVNRLLSQVIDDAKAANVPKEIITRNIEKGDQPSTADFKEMLFEYYGHGGVGILVNTLSDNENRVVKELHLVAKKSDLRPAAIGSVKFKFVRKARLEVNSLIEEDWLLNLCLENGVDDYELRSLVNEKIDGKETYESSIFVDVNSMTTLRDSLRTKGLEVQTSLAYLPLAGYLAVQEKDFNANIAAIEAFEELDDVDCVEHNMAMCNT